MNASTSPQNDLSGGASPEINVKWDESQHLTPLRTKLSVPPPRSSWIKRSRLVSRMDEGFARKLTLISAPAGFGKTTLIVDWVHTHKIPVAWFSVDNGDNDPLHFLTYVILGLQSLEKIGVRSFNLTDHYEWKWYVKIKDLTPFFMSKSKIWPLFSLGEEFLSVNWMEHFGETDQKAQIAKIREHIELSLAKYGLFAVLNVGKVIDQIQRFGEKRLTILHAPTQGDPSHSGVHGYQHEDLLVAELIAEMVIEIYPSRPT